MDIPSELLDKICKYEMDPASIVEDTEPTQFCPQTGGQTDGRMEGRCETSIPPFNFVEVIVINYSKKSALVFGIHVR